MKKRWITSFHEESRLVVGVVEVTRMPDIEQWLKDTTGTDFFKFTTPQEEVTAESLFWRAVTNELGVMVIPKDRNLQLRDFLPVVIVDTSRHGVRRMVPPEDRNNELPIKGFELDSMPRRSSPVESLPREGQLPRKPEKSKTADGLPMLPPLELDRTPLGRDLDDLFKFRRHK